MTTPRQMQPPRPETNEALRLEELRNDRLKIEAELAGTMRAQKQNLAITRSYATVLTALIVVVGLVIGYSVKRYQDVETLQTQVTTATAQARTAEANVAMERLRAEGRREIAGALGVVGKR